MNYLFNEGVPDMKKKCITNEAPTAKMVTISYPASPSRIIDLVKTLQHIIENLEDERKARSSILEKTKRKQSFFDHMQ